jgi:hypothetical protein
VVVNIHVLLTSLLVRSEWSALRPGRFTPVERAPGTHWIGGWVDPIAGLDDVKKRKFLTLTGFELRPLGRPARSQSLYRLRYPGYLTLFCASVNNPRDAMHNETRYEADEEIQRTLCDVHVHLLVVETDYGRSRRAQ